MSADLGREVGIETKPLQVNTQHLRRTPGGELNTECVVVVYVYLREFDNTHLLLTVLKSARGRASELSTGVNTYMYTVHVRHAEHLLFASSAVVLVASCQTHNNNLTQVDYVKVQQR